MQQALLLPDVDDPTSAAHQRIYKLALTMRRNFGIKLTLNSRVFRDSRQVDLRAAAEQDAAAPDAEKVRSAASATTKEILFVMDVLEIHNLLKFGANQDDLNKIIQTYPIPLAATMQLQSKAVLP